MTSTGEKTLVASGLAGFSIGLLHPSWQGAVEGAQVAAGIVQYPAGNPFGMFLSGMWTILNQMAALFLHLGGTEQALSLVLSGLAGMLLFQAVSMTVLALVDEAPISILAPFVVAFAADCSVNGLSYPGISYGVLLVGSPHTYGMIGLSFVLLALSSLGAGQIKLGGLLLGLSVAVHPGLGVWCQIIALISALADMPYLGKRLLKVWRFVAAGYSISALSLVYHFLANPQGYTYVSADKLQYFLAFIRHWDFHRRPFDIATSGLSLAILGMSLAILCLTLLKDDFTREARFLIRSLLIGGLLGGALAACYWLPAEGVPMLLLTMMPARLLNLDVLGFTAILIALLWRYRATSGVHVILVLLGAAILGARGLPAYGFMLPAAMALILALAAEKTRHGRAAAAILGAGFVLGGILLLSAVSQNPTVLGRYSPARFWGALFSFAIGVGLSLFAALAASRGAIPIQLRWLMRAPSNWGGASLAPVLVGVMVLGVVFRGAAGLRERAAALREDPALAAASRSPGMILTGGDMTLIQARTRRAVLLDGHALDGLPYVPAAGPELNRILTQVYGIDLLDPPPEIRRAHPGGLLPESGKALWESRSSAEWGVIGSRFGTGRILTPPGWNLRLPEVAQSSLYTLYEIPEYVARSTREGS